MDWLIWVDFVETLVKCTQWLHLNSFVNSLDKEESWEWMETWMTPLKTKVGLLVIHLHCMFLSVKHHFNNLRSRWQCGLRRICWNSWIPWRGTCHRWTSPNIRRQSPIWTGRMWLLTLILQRCVNRNGRKSRKRSVYWQALCLKHYPWIWSTVFLWDYLKGVVICKQHL